MRYIHVIQLLILCVDFVHSYFLPPDIHPRKYSSKDTKCCIRDEWEGTIFIDYGAVYIDQNTLATYYNGTMHVAYSIQHKKFYYSLDVVEQSPLIPNPIEAKSIELRDYVQGVTYTVSNGKCQKDELEKNMPRQCIPADATLLSRGQFGPKHLPLETYSFKQGGTDLPFDVTASVIMSDTVQPGQCEPFHATYFTPSASSGSGTMYSLNVMDIGPLSSKHLFDVPDSCKHLL